MISFDVVSLGLGFLAGLILTAIPLILKIFALEKEKAGFEARLESERAGLDEHFQSLAQKTLESNTQSFLTLAQEKLKQAQDSGKHDLDKRSTAIQEMVKPVQKHLEQLNSTIEQIKGTDKALREDLQNLSRETSKLSGALRNPAAQGKWGEFILEKLLEKANLMRGIHYESQAHFKTEDGNLRPDIVIKLQDGFHIVVDAKAPITDFVNRIDQELSEADILNLQKDLAAQVRKHIRALGSKNYQGQIDSPDFVVLFLPSEHIFSAALRADPDLIDFAADQQVIIASPTLMLSLLRVVGLSWRQVELAKNAQDISKLGSELFDRISTFAGHFERVGKGVESALGAYNKAVSSLETRVLVSARKLKDLHAADQGKEIETPNQIETLPKSLSFTHSSDELNENEEKKASNG